MRRMLRTLPVLLLLAAGSAQAQQLPPAVNFKATSATIAEGATDVDVNTTITLTIDPALPADDVLAQYGLSELEDLIVDLGGEITIENPTVSSDRTELSYDLTHEEDTDYALVFLGYVFDPNAQFTQLGIQPFALNYTTASTRASGSVSGTLVLSEMGGPNVNPDFTNAIVFITNNDDDNSYVDVVESSDNTFSIDGVAGGEYSALAVHYFIDFTNNVPLFSSALGFYDPDQNNVPDSFIAVAEGGAVEDVEITMQAFVLTVDAEDEGRVPEAVQLGASYPNPVVSATTVPFELSEAGEVRLRVYNLLGQEVATLVDGHRAPGAQTATWQVGNVPSGLYVVRLEAAGQVRTRSLVVMR